ncbi:TIGR02300 family protein [Ancylobacter sp. TS-1]|uniref:TIGR02300 family protein n=1 Tax=Ancylobacter sp. TS-1 TaxID=1850374 RepID=UPI001265C479|nr:TIGR02300 family protein [Ancylobacter sp. TS-1]QFR33981.1 TIGR02300 family protein [Ancylobacter sp. TS-1]
MVKPDLGTKRICPVTGRKFYDLNKDPVISPYTGQIVPITAPVSSRGRVEAPRPAEPDAELEESAEVELVSLEDADEEAAGTTKAVVADDDIDLDEEDVASDDEDVFLEEDEDGDDDVTDLIGDGIEDDEET